MSNGCEFVYCDCAWKMCVKHWIPNPNLIHQNTCKDLHFELEKIQFQYNCLHHQLQHL